MHLTSILGKFVSISTGSAQKSIESPIETFRRSMSCIMFLEQTKNPWFAVQRTSQVLMILLAVAMLFIPILTYAAHCEALREAYLDAGENLTRAISIAGLAGLTAAAACAAASAKKFLDPKLNAACIIASAAYASALWWVDVMMERWQEAGDALLTCLREHNNEVPEESSS